MYTATMLVALLSILTSLAWAGVRVDCEPQLTGMDAVFSKVESAVQSALVRETEELNQRAQEFNHTPIAGLADRAVQLRKDLQARVQHVDGILNELQARMTVVSVGSPFRDDAFAGGLQETLYQELEVLKKDAETLLVIRQQIETRADGARQTFKSLWSSIGSKRLTAMVVSSAYGLPIVSILTLNPWLNFLHRHGLPVLLTGVGLLMNLVPYVATLFALEMSSRHFMRDIRRLKKTQVEPTQHLLRKVSDEFETARLAIVSLFQSRKRVKLDGPTEDYLWADDDEIAVESKNRQSGAK